jgi:1-acyl-sn-glycerol-3-phosphate acyltransferase
MAFIHSLQVLRELLRQAIPTVADINRGQLTRKKIDVRAQQFASRVLDVLQIDLRVTGGQSLSNTRSYVYLSNHQSHLDIPMLYASLPSRTLRMVAKKELFAFPIWGPGLRQSEFVEIDRNDTDSSRASVLRAATLLEQGVSIWLAPEGTRSRDGRIGPLKKGGIRLARLTGAPIVPVAISGTRDILPRGSLAATRGRTVRVHIGEAIDVRNRTAPQLLGEVRAFLLRHVEARAASAGVMLAGAGHLERHA